MRIIFTLCSNNYLAQAKVLVDSVHLYNPNDKVIIGLVDELCSAIDYTFLLPAEIIPVQTIEIPDFQNLCVKYDLVELNPSVKASFFKFLMRNYPDAESVVYFDPDIKLYGSLEVLYIKLESADIVLTPHIISPISRDQVTPQENVFLKYGLYNLGFLAINPNGQEVSSFINWWEDRILNLGFNRSNEGLFVDQLWINLVPIFFKNVHILKELGYNMAPWNLHERFLLEKGDSYCLSDGSQLIFYHFSSFDYKAPDILCKPFYTRFTLQERIDLQLIYHQYYNEIIGNKVEFFNQFRCSFLTEESDEISIIRKNLNKGRIKSWLKLLMPPFFVKSA